MADSSANRDERIRVVLAELPPMVTAIVRDAVRGEDIRIVDEVGDRAELPDVVARRRAEVLIVPSEPSIAAQQHRALLRSNPGLKILTVAAIRGSTDLYELRLLGSNVGQRGVVEAIRAVVAERATLRREAEGSPASPGRGASPSFRREE